MIDLKTPGEIAIMHEGGKNTQDEALKNPICYDEETQELFGWFQTEIENRRKEEI